MNNTDTLQEIKLLVNNALPSFLFFFLSFFLTSPVKIRVDAGIRTKSYRKEIIAGDPWRCETGIYLISNSILNF